MVPVKLAFGALRCRLADRYAEDSNFISDDKQPIRFISWRCNEESCENSLYRSRLPHCGAAFGDDDDPIFTIKKANYWSALGMDIASNSQEHAGAINIESRLGKGAGFIIRLPKNE